MGLFFFSVGVLLRDRFLIIKTRPNRRSPTTADAKEPGKYPRGRSRRIRSRVTSARASDLERSRRTIETYRIVITIIIIYIILLNK